MPTDRLDELAVLLAIIDAGSLAAAARRLRRSPPAITRSLAQLEARLGARLVDRTTRALSPTEAGRALAEQARHLLAAYADAVREANEAPLRGRVRMTAPVVFGRRHVLPIVTAFLDLHPDIQVELLLADRNLDLVEDGLDAAVRIGKLADSGLLARRVGEVRRLVVASPAYLAAHGGPPRDPSDLARSHAVIFTASRPGPLEWRFAGPGRGRVVRPQPRLLVNEVEAALDAAREGRGLAMALSYQVADDLRSGALVRTLRDFEPPPLPVQIVVPAGHHRAPRVRALVEYATERLRALSVVAPESSQ